MPHATCAHCGTLISDHSTMQQSAGKTYCCRNCVAMAAGATTIQPGVSLCAHCESQIVDESTKVERGGQTFCCNNCATAMSEGARHRTP
jgi:hypothetical protein